MTHWQLAMILAATLLSFATQAIEPAWAGKGACRILLMVPPDDIGSRPSDEMPAVVTLDLETLLHAAGIDGRVDLSTLQVMRYDSETGRPMPYGRYLHMDSEFDRPLQWYDGAIPEPFPDRDRYLDKPWVFRSGWGRYYDTVGDGKRGRLAWSHTQDASTASYYAVYFNLLGEGQEATLPPPRHWVGDGAARHAPIGTQSTGIYHVDGQMVDFNEDGLLDLLCGTSRGGVLWFENMGTVGEPKFTVPRLLFHADGHPIDPGFLSTPVLTDWDRDGANDLLVGAKGGWVYFYRNVGTNLEPRYDDRGPIMSDGNPVRTPANPVPEVEGPNGEGIYKEDYEPFTAVVDWDGDGEDDLLAGGYVTGRIYWYRSTERDASGVPVLESRGEILADGKPIDVGWCANPATGDLDGDGDLDLISGVWRKWGNERPPEVVEDFLAYYENIGTRSSPNLTMKALPRIGRFPDEIIARPSIVDWNGDGLLDLATTTSTGTFYRFKNVGDAHHPKFDTREPNLLQIPWGNDALPYATRIADWNGDSIPDLLNGSGVALGTTRKLPWAFGGYTSAIPAGYAIDHRSWRGDDWAFTEAVDFDQDGGKDILFGDYWGNIWFHKNTSTAAAASLDTKGVLINTETGKPLQVGLTEEKAYDFDSMQGPRTSFVASDFDGDGAIDLVINDVYGHYYFCRRGKHGDEPVVESQVLITKLKGYATTCVVDWDEDGRPDLLVSQLQNHLLFRNTGKGGSQSLFAAPEKLDLPLVPVLESVVRVMTVDAHEDGDRDLVISSDHGHDCLMEGSFLKRGYATAEILKSERYTTTSATENAD